MLLPMEDAWPARPADGFQIPPHAWLDEDGDVIAPLAGDPPPDEAYMPWGDELHDLIALRPSRRAGRPRAHA